MYFKNNFRCIMFHTVQLIVIARKQLTIGYQLKSRRVKNYGSYLQFLTTSQTTINFHSWIVITARQVN